MCKNKASYINKSLLVQMLLSILLFANCDTKLDLTSIPVGAELAQEELQRENEPEKKKKRFAFDQQENTELVQQTQTGFSSLPIELQAYIFTLLDDKNFHRASLVCHAWRDAALMAGEGKILDLSRRKLDEKDCQVLLQVPFSSLILKECGLGDQEVRILSQSKRIKHLDLFYNSIGAAGAKATGVESSQKCCLQAKNSYNNA
jgi:hypothetical protein